MSASPPLRACPRCGEAAASAELLGMCPRCLAFAVLREGPAPGEAAGVEAGEPALRRVGGFELVEEIARGGMGVVFRARQEGLNREVAVKLMREAWLATPEMVRRFKVEASAAARLRHPRIIAIHEIGEDAGQHYFAMDLVEGSNLAELTRTRPLPVGQAARIAVEVAEAVQHAHERGVLHRDLKPSNVLLDARGEPYVTDFGLARPLDEPSSLTETGQVLGTPGYMAPEQAEGGSAVGPAADVYGIGALLFHLLTARAPFVGAGPAATLSQVLQRDPLSPRLLNPAVPEDLAAACLKCLAKRPSERYRSAGEVAEDLGRFLRGEPTQVRPAGPAERAWRWCRRQPALAAAIATACMALVLGMAGTIWQARAAWENNRTAARHLWQAQGLEARNWVESGRQGQRHQTLRLVSEAARLGASDDLRNTAIAALARLDLDEIPFRQPARQSNAHTIVPPTYAVSPDGARIAAWHTWGAAETRLTVEPFGEPGESVELDHDGKAGNELVFSPDGRNLAARYYAGAEVAVWDLARRRIRWVRSLPTASDFSLEFSHDGRHLAACLADGGIGILGAADGREDEARIPVPAGAQVLRARFSPDGRRLAVVVGPTVFVWDIREGREIFRADFPVHPTPALAWHPDGERLAVGCWQRPEIHVLHLGDPASRRILTTGGGAPFLLMFSPAGDLLMSRGVDSVSRCWDFASERLVLATDQGLASGWTADGQRLVFDLETRWVGLWRVERSPIHRTYKGAGGALFAAPPAFEASGRAVLWPSDRGVTRVHLESGVVSTMPGPSVSALLLDPRDASLLTAGTAGLALHPVQGAPTWFTRKPLLGMARSLDGRVLAGIDVDGVTLFGASNRVLALAGGARPCSVAVEPGGRWVAVGTEDAEGIVLDPIDGREVHRFGGHRLNLVFSPDGRWLVSGSGADYGLWSTTEWRRVRGWDRRTALARESPIAISPDGRLLALALTSRAVSLVDPQDGREVARLEAPTTSSVGAMAFGPDGRHLAVHTAVGCLELWDLHELRVRLRGLGLDWSSPQPTEPPSP